jgi:trigger factor
MTSRQYGIEPQQLFTYLQENNQLPAIFADVRRGLAIAAVVEAATVTDSDGNTIDTGEFFGKRQEADEAEPAGEAEEAEEGVDQADEDSDMADETDKADDEAK